MTDQPPAYETAEEILTRVRALFVDADRWLTLALGPPRLRRDQELELDPSSCFVRAHSCAEVASAGARIAQAMVGAEHLDLLREFEERVDARTASENGQPDAFPCPDCDYVAYAAPRLGAHLALAHHRDPYDPPTLSGPYDPDREHGR